MRPDGWILMIASWATMTGLLTFALIRTLARKQDKKDIHSS